MKRESYDFLNDIFVTTWIFDGSNNATLIFIIHPIFFIIWWVVVYVTSLEYQKKY